ncbi:MAG: CRISPR-associated endonuclease Cas1 [Proteobacteria bacterium]|nr:CRISPR-associated endonuclease Cas1 [Pseudomonadota bacterium]
MSVLYITDEGTYLTRQGDQLVVMKRGNVIQAVPGHKLNQVVVFGNAQVSSGARTWLLDAGIETIFLTMGGKLRGRTIPDEGRNIDVRRHQFRQLDTESTAIDLARRFVEGKLVNCRTLLQRHQRARPNTAVEMALHRLRHASAKVQEASTLDMVRGFEGAGAAAYFGVFNHLVLVEGFPFGGRTRRPPLDALNAMLSFGYTLLLGTVRAAVQIVGLDPYLGSLHAPENNKPAMVLDLMEEFRPLLVDAVVLRAVNRRQITPDEFAYGVETDHETDAPKPPLAVLLGRDTMKKWILLYEDLLRQTIVHRATGLQLTWRDVVLEQTRAVARHLKGEAPYEAFTIR